MHHSVDFVPRKDAIDSFSIVEIGLHEGRFGVDCRGVTLAEVIEHNHRITCGYQTLDSDTTDISGATGHKNFHTRVTVKGVSGRGPTNRLGGRKTEKRRFLRSRCSLVGHLCQEGLPWAHDTASVGRTQNATYFTGYDYTEKHGPYK